jgi:hypothetical protein
MSKYLLNTERFGETERDLMLDIDEEVYNDP